jgi:hypothetical protein
MNKAQLYISNIIRSELSDKDKTLWLASWSHNITKSTPKNPNKGIAFTYDEIFDVRRQMLENIAQLVAADFIDNKLVVVSLESLLMEIPDLWGCTDPNAPNWNPDAIYDDGSCLVYANNQIDI